MSEQVPIIETLIPDLDAGSVAGDSLRSYLNAISRTPLLTAEEEVLLCRRIEAGVFAGRIIDLQGQLKEDPTQVNAEDKQLAQKYSTICESLALIAADGDAAKNHMIQANLKLVVSIAKRYQNRGLDFQDVISEGNFGLMHAVEKFDYTKGFKFSTYGTWWIMQAVSRGISDQGRTIRVPNNMVDEVNKSVRLGRQFFQENGREATDIELADLVGTNAEKARRLKEISRLPISLDSPFDIGGDDRLGDFIEDTTAIQPETAVIDEMTQTKIFEAINQLEPRQALIIKRRYGIDCAEPQKLDQVGQEIGVTRERVRQIQKKAEESLRSIFKKFGITSLNDY
jgi:RNA polymerase nonessential primary-like sigma factor